MSLNELSAPELRDRLATGALQAIDVADAFLARAAALDGDIGAFAYLDPAHVRAQAQALDEMRRSGHPVAPLHGLPVAVKDIIDTADMPTENGTLVDAGRRPAHDAHVVERLRAAGAIVMGKTVTTELAYFTPPRTRNPHHRERTPGGSSSGSAAAVAAHMAPLALGTQTAGSVIRPAAFCGVVGFKPTFGAIARSGVLPVAPRLDTIGVFAGDVAGAALLADCLFGHHQDDPASRHGAWPRLLETVHANPPAAPRLAFMRQPAWEEAYPHTRQAFAALLARLAEKLRRPVEDVALPEIFDPVLAVHRTIMSAEYASSLGHYHDRGGERLSPHVRGLIEEGRALSARDYLAALAQAEALTTALDAVFTDFDAIVTPAAAGEAPGLETTGSPAFCSLWTLCGTPSISLPLLRGQSGLPLGVQLVGARGDDARLLRSAAWLTRLLDDKAER